MSEYLDPQGGDAEDDIEPEEQLVYRKPEKAKKSSSEKQRVKVLKPIREEDQPSNVCMDTYKNVFKQVHMRLKINKIGQDCKSKFFRSPSALKVRL